MAYRLGIDLGNTNTIVAVAEDGGAVRVLPNAEGQPATRSIVSFHDRRVAVGEPPAAGDGAEPSGDVRIVSGMKRYLGHEGYVVRVGETNYLPQEILALILSKVRRDAEAALGGTSEADSKRPHAVLTVPPHFSALQRDRMREAGELAGLQVDGLIDEPAAAAMAAGLPAAGAEIICVYGMGGATFHVSLLRLRKGRLELLSTRSDLQLGGDEFDLRVRDHLMRRFTEDTGQELSDSSLGAGGKLREVLLASAEGARRELSQAPETRVSIPEIVRDRSLSLDVALTREEIESLTGDLIRRTEFPVEEALADAGLGLRDVEAVILSGGATRMPAVRRFVSDLFGREPLSGLDPQTLPAMGAATGPAAHMPPEGEAAAPAPEEVGKAPEAGNCGVEIGVECEGGRIVPLIRKGQPLPASDEMEFTTATEAQTAINIPVWAGPSLSEPSAPKRHGRAGGKSHPKANTLLGEIRLEGIEPAPAGVPRVAVSFELASDGLLRSVARNCVTGRKIALEVALPGAIRNWRED
jgi:molecular chaperone DnaK